MISSTPRTDSALIPDPENYNSLFVQPVEINSSQEVSNYFHWTVFAAAIFLVSVPVFIQAPLVRFLPWLSLALTPALALAGWRLMARPATSLWGDLLLGFTWTWLSGSLYWGWLRWEPLLHLPVEAIGLPFALWGISRGWGRVGNLFYLGSLFGTAITDLYFYIVDLIPHWRSLMQVDESAIHDIFQSAILQIQTPWGTGWAFFLTLVLLVVGILPLRDRQPLWWSFGGAVVSTILVDGLFWIAALVS